MNSASPHLPRPNTKRYSSMQEGKILVPPQMNPCVSHFPVKAQEEWEQDIDICTMYCREWSWLRGFGSKVGLASSQPAVICTMPKTHKYVYIYYMHVHMYSKLIECVGTWQNFHEIEVVCNYWRLTKVWAFGLDNIFPSANQTLEDGRKVLFSAQQFYEEIFL